MLTLEDVKDTFAFFDNWQDRYRYIIDLGKALPAMAEAERVEENLVKGCQSLVWLVMTYDSATDKVTIRLDSDAFIVKGLIAIVLTVFQHRAPSTILATDVEPIFEELGLIQHLSPTRGNGLRAMVQRIKQEAAAALERSIAA